MSGAELEQGRRMQHAMQMQFLETMFDSAFFLVLLCRFAADLPHSTASIGAQNAHTHRHTDKLGRVASSSLVWLCISSHCTQEQKNTHSNVESGEKNNTQNKNHHATHHRVSRSFQCSASQQERVARETTRGRGTVVYRNEHLKLKPSSSTGQPF